MQQEAEAMSFVPDVHVFKPLPGIVVEYDGKGNTVDKILTRKKLRCLSDT